MVFFFNIFASLLVQYFIIISCKNLMSYNEELFLFTIYILLFIIILNSMPAMIKNQIIRESFNLIEFYEKLFYLKMLLLLKVIVYYNVLIKKEGNKYILYNAYRILLKNELLYKNMKKKKNLELFYIINNYIEKIKEKI